MKINASETLVQRLSQPNQNMEHHIQYRYTLAAVTLMEKSLILWESTCFFCTNFSLRPDLG